MKKYLVIMETYKYDVAYESEEFDQTEEVLGEYKDKESAKGKVEDVFNALLGEMKEAGVDFRSESDDVSSVVWDYGSVDDEGYVKKYILYVK